MVKSGSKRNSKLVGSETLLYKAFHYK